MRRLIVLAGLAWPLLATAQAQSPPLLGMAAGDSIRVLMISGLQLEGNLARHATDSLGLRRSTAGAYADTVVSLTAVSEVEARVRRRTAGSALKGFGIGALAGVAAGGLIAGASMSNCTGEMCALAVLWVPVVGVAGSVVGLLVGAVRTSETWDVVWRRDDVRP